MSFLLDTCTFLWLAGDPQRLTPQVAELIADPASDVRASPVSLWEILVKHKAGRSLPLSVPARPERYFVELRIRHGLDSLPVDEEAVGQLVKLPDLHRDPFDRLLICQAIAHSLTILTPDEQIARYPVRTLW